MRLEPYQVWYNVTKNNVTEVKVINATSKEVALTIISNLLKRNVPVVKLRNNWGQWLEYKGGYNG